jgi:hypothetical protein
MSKVYRIHPTVGIARVGDSPDGFFIGPELVDAPPLELDGNGNDVPFTSYKKNGLIKRQGARFRVFEYDEDANEALTNAREVIASDDVQIVWKVQLVNRKAAWDKAVMSKYAPRNPQFSGADRSKLVIAPGAQTIAGANKFGVKFDNGSFLGINVLLGELRTDGAGRLVVLGGYGKSGADRDDRAIGGDNFADNAWWYDDVSDGPVTVTVSVKGVAQTVRGSAWVIVAPPDFAPAVGGAVSMYDAMQQVAVDAFGVKTPPQPSFTTDIQPILRRCASLKWTHPHVLWTRIPENWQDLCNATGAPADKLRRDTATRLSGSLPLRATGSAGDMLQLTPTQKGFLKAWADGNFVRDWGQAPKPSRANPADVDRGPLDSAVGGGFFPGIEAGNRLMDSSIYQEAFRLRVNLLPGFMTEQMALPWQSDFYQCETNWWPAQRPDVAHQKANPNKAPGWIEKIISVPGSPGNEPERQMVKKFSKLGYIKSTIVGGQLVQVEDERDPAFPR